MNIVGPGKSIPGIHLEPSAINIVKGTLNSGDVDSIKTWSDGDVLDVQESAGVPGFNIEITFPNVKSFRRVGLSAYYNGSSSHWFEYQFYDEILTTWRTLWKFDTNGGLNYRYTDIPIDSRNFIDGSDNVKTRLYHPESGNAAHKVVIGYATLII